MAIKTNTRCVEIALLLAEAPGYTDRDAYVSDLSLSSIWGDGEDDPIPPERIDLIGRVYDALHSTLPELLQIFGMSQTAFAAHFGIPFRSVQNWYLGTRKCPPYLLPMCAKLLMLDPHAKF